MKTKDNWFDRLLLNKWFYITTTLVFIGIFACVFMWNHKICIRDVEYIVDNDLLGTYGDFIGGVLGTIFAMISIIILIKTFNSQRAVTEKNERQIDNQRFNDLFFELLRLYQSEVSELYVAADEEKYTDKNFFDYWKRELQEKFCIQKSYQRNIRESVKLYMNFYVKNRTKLAAVYRTLYRIYDLLDKSELEESVKKSYLKIIRAQLTDSELFFLRYNSGTDYGRNFIHYINKYNILKHLPAFDLLEFKDWWENLSEEERVGINIVFYRCTRILRGKLLKDEDIPILHQRNQKYIFSIDIPNKSEIEITLKINKHLNNNTMEYSGFVKMDKKKIQALLDCYLKEFLLHSNFCRINQKGDIEFYSNPIREDDTYIVINSGARSNKNVALLRYES